MPRVLRTFKIGQGCQCAKVVARGRFRGNASTCALCAVGFFSGQEHDMPRVCWGKFGNQSGCLCAKVEATPHNASIRALHGRKFFR